MNWNNGDKNIIECKNNYKNLREKMLNFREKTINTAKT